MKYLKVFVVAILTFITFGAAQAQVVVRAHVGPRHHVYHHRHWHRHHYYHHHR